MGRNKTWSKEELDYLQDRWGSVSIKSMSRSLGRTANAIRIKARRMNLNDARTHYDGITINQLSLALGVSYSTVSNWIERHDFPVREKVFAMSKKVSVVNYKDFWEWAEENKQMIDFSKVEHLILGAEPEWVRLKRKADSKNSMKSSPWTDAEEKKLRNLVESHKYTYPEISNMLGRSEGAIKRRLGYLGIKARPLRLCNHVKYTTDEIQTIKNMYEEGYHLSAIASAIDKSALGVRGKMERMGYRFKNGVPIIENKLGKTN